MAAVLVLLSGAANALAQPTVRCVPNHNINSSCTSTDYSTIHAAVTAANEGDTILVAPGNYKESVTIPIADISLLGAQAGNDARIDRHDPNKESIIDASTTGVGSAIIVSAENVLIDGFTVQGGGPSGDASGIDLKGTCKGFNTATGADVFNNIIQNNGTGISLNFDGCGQNETPGTELIGVLIEHNLIKNNNVTQGEGIYAVQYAIIIGNAFSGNNTRAIDVVNSSNVTITSNTSESDSSFVIFSGTTNAVFSQNRGEGLGHKGSLPGYINAAVAIVPGNQYLVISDNWLEAGTASGDGIAFVWYSPPSGPANTNLYVTNNKIRRFLGKGIVAWPNTLSATLILGNQVEDNGSDGILIESGENNVGNSFFDNEAEGNSNNDCEDDTSGSGTLGRGNTWFHNTGNLSVPAGLCTPGKWHDRDWR
jgi:hypothetical protein